MFLTTQVGCCVDKTKSRFLRDLILQVTLSTINKGTVIILYLLTNTGKTKISQVDLSIYLSIHLYIYHWAPTEQYRGLFTFEEVVKIKLTSVAFSLRTQKPHTTLN